LSDYSWETHEFRRAAQTALRRLGEKPRPLAAMTLEDMRTHKGVRRLNSMPAEPREQQIDQLRPEMAVEEVLRDLGPPDDIHASQWRYDMDPERPSTLILLWRDGRVKRIVTEVPPLWQTEKWCVGDFFFYPWIDTTGREE
jgi:hypothetical protein